MAKILKRLFGGEANVRPTAFSGTMYPDDSGEVRTLLSDALASHEMRQPWRAAVVPHSDLSLVADFSAEVWRSAPQKQHRIERYVVVAPAFRIPFRGIGVTSFDAFATPFGEIPIDMQDYAPLEGATMVRLHDEAHRAEPGIELQLPWIQHVAPRARIVPVLVGDASTEDVAWVLDRLVDERSALVVACELSEDLNAEEARSLDTQSMRILEELGDTTFEFGQVSARKPLAALIQLARSRGWTPSITSHTDSHALGGPSERVRGYAAVSMQAEVR